MTNGRVEVITSVQRRRRWSAAENRLRRRRGHLVATLFALITSPLGLPRNEIP